MQFGATWTPQTASGPLSRSGPVQTLVSHLRLRRSRLRSRECLNPKKRSETTTAWRLWANGAWRWSVRAGGQAGTGSSHKWETYGSKLMPKHSTNKNFTFKTLSKSALESIQVWELNSYSSVQNCKSGPNQTCSVLKDLAAFSVLFFKD